MACSGVRGGGRLAEGGLQNTTVTSPAAIFLARSSLTQRKNKQSVVELTFRGKIAMHNKVKRGALELTMLVWHQN